MLEITPELNARLAAMQVPLAAYGEACTRPRKVTSAFCQNPTEARGQKVLEAMAAVRAAQGALEAAQEVVE